MPWLIAGYVITGLLVLMVPVVMGAETARKNLEKQMEETEDEIADYQDEQERRIEDYRRSHCHGCGKVI